MTHTEPDGMNPWWEVDLGGVRQIEAIRVYNRNGNSDRLENFTIRILDENRKSVFSKEKCPATPVAEFLFEGIEGQRRNGK